MYFKTCPYFNMTVVFSNVFACSDMAECASYNVLCSCMLLHIQVVGHMRVSVFTPPQAGRRKKGPNAGNHSA